MGCYLPKTRTKTRMTPLLWLLLNTALEILVSGIRKINKSVAKEDENSLFIDNMSIQLGNIMESKYKLLELISEFNNFRGHKIKIKYQLYF